MRSRLYGPSVRRFEGGGHGVIPASAPRVTAGDPGDSQPEPFEKSMPAQGPDKVFRAGRLVAASASRAAQRPQGRREHQLVDPDQYNEQRSHARGGKIESQRPRSNHSPRNSLYDASSRAGTNRPPRAVLTTHFRKKSQPPAFCRAMWWRRKLSYQDWGSLEVAGDPVFHAVLRVPHMFDRQQLEKSACSR